MEWNFNMDEAPKGDYVTTKRGETTTEVFKPVFLLLAAKPDLITKSYWIPEQNRWCAFTAPSGSKQQPFAWMLWPEFPNKESQPK